MMQHLRALRWSAWLGWQIESNWTDPLLFGIYVFAKPLAGSLLLVCMYWAVQESRPDMAQGGLLPFLFVSSACYMLVGSVAFGLSWTVIADRDHYGMLKYVYISPCRFRSYLVGRGLARAGEAVLGSCLTLMIGIIFFPELRAALLDQPPALGWLLTFVLLGTALLGSIGMCLAGTVLNTTRNGMFLSEGVAGILYLLSGAVYPISVLPGWLQPISMMLPTTYWLEGMRRVLLGSSNLPSRLDAWSLGELALMLAAGTLALGVFTHYYFAWCERRAWRIGRLDESAGY